MHKITLVLCEQMEIVRKGVKALLETNPSMAVIGEASDGQGTINKVRDLSPDILVLDLSLPTIDGIDVIRKTKKISPKTRTLILTAKNEEQLLVDAIEAGVDGYILKYAPHEELFSAIVTIASGGNYFCKIISSMIAKVCSGGVKSPKKIDLLTRREKEVLRLTALGMNNRKIAETTSVTIKTVEKHKTNIHKKLGIATHLGLATFCLKSGLVEEDGLFGDD